MRIISIDYTFSCGNAAYAEEDAGSKYCKYHSIHDRLALLCSMAVVKYSEEELLG